MFQYKSYGMRLILQFDARFKRYDEVFFIDCNALIIFSLVAKRLAFTKSSVCSFKNSSGFSNLNLKIFHLHSLIHLLIN